MDKVTMIKLRKSTHKQLKLFTVENGLRSMDQAVSKFLNEKKEEKKIG
jgi:hypothetical protein